MYITDKTILAHKGYFDAESVKLYKENSRKVCSISSTKDYISIIELDLRKSKDGILYCYHGSFFEYWISLKFSKNFNVIKTKYSVDTLAEILEVIDQNKIIFLDFKDHNVTREDVLTAFSHKKFSEVILGNRSVSFLERFNKMPKEFVKIMNGNIFFSFYDPKKLKSKGYKYVQAVFPFQVNKRVIEKVKASGLEFTVAALFFLNKETYWKKINGYNIKNIISSDFI